MFELGEMEEVEDNMRASLVLLQSGEMEMEFHSQVGSTDFCCSKPNMGKAMWAMLGNGIPFQFPHSNKQPLKVK